MRAVAVIAVIVYHLNLEIADTKIFPGGFLGVDIFFVISGYLISAIIFREMDQNNFSFRNFYLRRIRRILPPLIAVIIFSTVYGWFVLLPSDLQRLASSAIAAIGFFSNVFWFFAQGEYGAQSSLLQPLLHTWSLGIEEQFYLVYPLFILISMRFTKTISVLILCLMTSFIASYLTTQVNPDLSFFSPISRVWELLVGSLLAFAERRSKAWGRDITLAKFVPSMGLVVVVWSMMFMELEGSGHPGIATLPVILAVASIIWFAAPSEPATRFLAAQPSVTIGKWSYSLYLWHYPIFAFGRMEALEPSWISQALWVATTIVLAAACYYAVERPFRFRLGNIAVLASISASAAAVGLFFVAAVAFDGFAARHGELAKLYGVNQFDNEKLKRESWSVLDEFSGTEEISTWNAHNPSEHEKSARWFTGSDTRKVLLIGNSHSKDMFNALYLNSELFERMEFARFAVTTHLPREQLELLYASPNFAASDLVVISSKYQRATLDRLPMLLDELGERGKRVVLVDNTAEFSGPSYLPIFDWWLRRNGTLEGMAQYAYTVQAAEVARVNQALRALASERGVTLLSRRDLVCTELSQTCDLVTAMGRKAMYDYGHWTLEGAEYFGRKAFDAGWYDILLRESGIPTADSVTTSLDFSSSVLVRSDSNR